MTDYINSGEINALREELRFIIRQITWLEEEKWVNEWGEQIDEEVWDVYDQGYIEGLRIRRSKLFNKISELEREMRNEHRSNNYRNDLLHAADA